MKKVSTVAAKPSQKISRQKLTVGLDLGDRNSWYCALDESGQIQLEQRVRTNAKALRGCRVVTWSTNPDAFSNKMPTNVTAQGTIPLFVPSTVRSRSVTPAVDGATGSVTANWIVDANFASLTYPNFNTGSWGILLECASGVTVTGNTISNTQSGIVLQSGSCPLNTSPTTNSDNNNISGNFISGSHLFEGIYVCGNNNTIQNNFINSSDEAAVYIDTSCNGGGSGNSNTVASNKINEACAGVLLNPLATGNTIGSNRLANVNFTQVGGSIGANVCDAPGDANGLVKMAPQN